LQLVPIGTKLTSVDATFWHLTNGENSSLSERAVTKFLNNKMRNEGIITLIIFTKNKKKRRTERARSQKF